MASPAYGKVGVRRAKRRRQHIEGPPPRRASSRRAPASAAPRALPSRSRRRATRCRWRRWRGYREDGMNLWEWETFADVVNSDEFSVTNAGPLLTPIRTFAITRNEKLELILETSVLGDVERQALDHPAGTVRRATEMVEFAGHAGSSCVAHGVSPRNYRTTWNNDGVAETKQRAKVHSLTARLKNDAEAAYTIDWLENLDSEGHLWTGSFVRDKHETIDTRTIGHGTGQVELSARARSGELVLAL